MLLALVHVSQVCTERVPLLNYFRNLVSHLFALFCKPVFIFCSQINLALHFVTKTFVTGYVLYGFVQDRELLLQELNAVVCNLLCHLDVEVRVTESLVLG